MGLVVATPILFGVVGIALGEVVYFTVFGVGIAVALWFLIPWLVQRSVEAQLKRTLATGNLGRPRPDSVSPGIEFNACTHTVFFTGRRLAR